jgi:hypothetical protein
MEKQLEPVTLGFDLYFDVSLLLRRNSRIRMGHFWEYLQIDGAVNAAVRLVLPPNPN